MPTQLDQLVAVRSQAMQALLDFAERILGSKQVAGLGRFSLELEVGQDGSRTRLSDLLRTTHRVAVHGSPGSGKTVFLRKTLRMLALSLHASITARDRNAGRAQLPIYLETGLAQGGASVSQLVLRRLGRQGDPVEILSRLLERVDIVLLLDGLNEITNQNDRQVALRDVVNFADALDARGHAQALHVVMTSRTYGLADDLAHLQGLGFTLVEVLPVDPRQIERELATNIGITRTKARELLQTLAPNLRLLLATPQHLDYVIQWCRDATTRGESLEGMLRTRGALLDYCVLARLRQRPEQQREAIKATLRQLAYAQQSGSVFFPRSTVTKTAQATATLGMFNAAEVVDLLFALGFLVDVDGHCRFDHHSHQQYFLACEMADRPGELAHYVRNELWHEPLVILAGLLKLSNSVEFLALLDRIRGNRPLFAYVLAHVDEPERARQCLRETITAFTAKTRYVALHLTMLLAGLAVCWLIVFLLLGLGTSVAPHEAAQWVLAILTCVHFCAGLSLMLRWHGRRGEQTLARLRARDLPELIAVNRAFRERGAMEMVHDQLEDMLSTLRHRHHYAPDDPRVHFISDALNAISDAIDTVSFLSEDELLAQLADPVVAAAIDPEMISGVGLDALCAQATDVHDGAAQANAVRVLGRIYAVRPEFRDRIAKALFALVRDETQTRAVRSQVVQQCHRLRLVLPHVRGRRFGIGLLFAILVGWLRRLLGATPAPGERKDAC